MSEKQTLSFVSYQDLGVFYNVSKNLLINTFMYLSLCLHSSVACISISGIFGK